MRQLLLILCLLGIQTTHAQKGFLLVKKNGKKVRTYEEGSLIRVQIGQRELEGFLTLLKDNKVYINETAYDQSEIKKIYLPVEKKKGVTAKQLVFTTAGVALSTFGMTASKSSSFETSLLNSAVIGFSSVVLSELKRRVSFRRKEYKIGKKFTVQVLDFYLPVQSR